MLLDITNEKGKYKIQVTEDWFRDNDKPIFKLKVRDKVLEFVYITEGKFQYIGKLEWDEVVSLLHEYRRGLK
jgi:hypothetical protein